MFAGIWWDYHPYWQVSYQWPFSLRSWDGIDMLCWLKICSAKSLCWSKDMRCWTTLIPFFDNKPLIHQPDLHRHDQTTRKEPAALLSKLSWRLYHFLMHKCWNCSHQLAFYLQTKQNMQDHQPTRHQLPHGVDWNLRCTGCLKTEMFFWAPRHHARAHTWCHVLALPVEPALLLNRLQ